MFKEPIFVNPKAVISPGTQVIFVADLFVDDYVGGDELTSEALISESPFTIQKLRSRDVNLATLQQGVDKFWVFGNFSQLNPELIPSIVANLKYAVLEYDYKYCRFRSPEKHLAETGSPCDCHDQITGKLVSAFYHGATSLWWMSEAQKDRYTTLFPFLLEKDNVVLSSVFSKNTLGTLKVLRDKVPAADRKGWIVLGSQSWVKGFDAAKKWCEETGKDHEVVWNLPYDQVLAKMASAEGFVYLPAGADTCPRMVIEAKLLGCKLHLNEHVQHSTEEWFATDDAESIHEYLYTAPQLFWKGIRTIMEYRPKISGYTTTYNCVSQGYPFEASIRSMLQFCDEVCVVDGGSTDGTLERLLSLLNTSLNASEIDRLGLMNDLEVGLPVTNEIDGKRLRVKLIKRDWNHPRFAVFDGMQKAEARKMCTGDFCWQMDSDEIVLKKDAHKVIDLCSKFPQGVNIISLPVLDLWGSRGKVRLDTTPWKWRLSRNDPRITHGIPAELRRLDVNGDVYSAPGSDGCDMIDSESGKRLDHVTFVSSESENARILALRGDKNALTAYQNWMMNVVGSLPSVVHYSWFDLERKIKTYKGYWSRHWESLYNVPQEDTANNNMFFDKPWADVDEKEIKDLAQRLEEIGGWIWHSKWDGTVTPHMTLDISDND